MAREEDGGKVAFLDFQGANQVVQDDLRGRVASSTRVWLRFPRLAREGDETTSAFTPSAQLLRLGHGSRGDRLPDPQRDLPERVALLRSFDAHALLLAHDLDPHARALILRQALGRVFATLLSVDSRSTSSRSAATRASARARRRRAPPGSPPESAREPSTARRSEPRTRRAPAPGAPGRTGPTRGRRPRRSRREAVEADVDGAPATNAPPRRAVAAAPPPVASIANRRDDARGNDRDPQPLPKHAGDDFRRRRRSRALAPPPRADAGSPAVGPVGDANATSRSGCFSRRPTRPTGPRRSRPRARGDRERTSSRAPPGGARSGALSLSRETKTRRSIDRGSGSRPPPPTWGPMRSSRTPRALCPHRPRPAEERLEGGSNRGEPRLVVPAPVHLVHRDDEVPDAEGSRELGVLARLPDAAARLRGGGSDPSAGSPFERARGGVDDQKPPRPRAPSPRWRSGRSPRAPGRPGA